MQKLRQPNGTEYVVNSRNVIRQCASRIVVRLIVKLLVHIVFCILWLSRKVMFIRDCSCKPDFGPRPGWSANKRVLTRRQNIVVVWIIPRDVNRCKLL